MCFTSLLLDNLNDVLVVELVQLSDLLWVVLDGGAPNLGVVHLSCQGLVEFATEVLNLAMLGWHDDGLLVVGDLSLRLGIYSNQIEVFPDLQQELVEVPLVLGGDWHVVGHLV